MQQLRSNTAGNNPQKPVQLVLAENLTSDFTSRFNTEETASIDLIVAERHPLKSADDALIAFTESLPCQCRVAYHLSLDDPLLRRFIGGFVEKILENLRMKEDEPLGSEMLGQRIKAAQKKIEQQAFGNSRAKSAAEWLELNMPNS